MSSFKSTTASTAAHVSSKKSTGPIGGEDTFSTRSLNGAKQAWQESEYFNQAKPSDEMVKRWLKNISMRVPTIDLVDIAAESGSNKTQKRQFAPQYSQDAYMTMLVEEEAIGDYT